MRFHQLNERLRQEILRRIQRGTLSGKLISRKTGYGQPHISNFLRGKRNLSLDALDSLLSVLQMDIEDLLPSRAEDPVERGREENQRNKTSPQQEHDLQPALQGASSARTESIPLVTQAVALEEQVFLTTHVIGSYSLPASILGNLRSFCRPSRRSWQRFVAIRLHAGQSEAMEPVLMPGALVVIDRHYTSLKRDNPERPSLYALHCGRQIMIRYLSYEKDLLILRPYQHAHAVTTIEVRNGQSPSDYILGRVVLVVNAVE
jgi:transcriptional regulator with XRE-family HTH domain